MDPKEAETRRKMKVLAAYIEKQVAAGTAPQELYKDLITRKVPHKLAVKMINQGLAQAASPTGQSHSQDQLEAARLDKIRALINAQADAGKTVNKIRDQLVEQEVSPQEAAALILEQTGLEVSPLDAGPQVSPFLPNNISLGDIPAIEDRKEIVDYVSTRLSAGMELKKLVDTLIEHGMERNQAINLVMDLKQKQEAELREVAAKPPAKTREELRKSGLRNLLIGSGLFLVGAIITVISYLTAQEGGAFWLFYGPIIFGLVYAVFGLAQWLRNR